VRALISSPPRKSSANALRQQKLEQDVYVDKAFALEPIQILFFPVFSGSRVRAQKAMASLIVTATMDKSTPTASKRDKQHPLPWSGIVPPRDL